MVGGNGIVTEYSYNDAGCVTRAVRKDGSDVLSSVDVASSKGTTYFNDLLGTTVGAKSGNRYSAAALSAFGERLDKVGGAFPAIRSLGEGWFTGKPEVAGLGHVFLMRNYRASLGKWQTADPLGYPDGWNQLAYCGNGVTGSVDLWGCATVESVRIYDIMNNKTYEQRLEMTKITNDIIKALRRKAGALTDRSSVVDTAWEVVETPLNEHYGEWEGFVHKYRDVDWDDKIGYFELIKHEQVLPKSTFDLLIEDFGNVASLAAIPTVFGATGAVFTAITATGGGVTGYHVIFAEEKTVTIGYTYEATGHTRLVHHTKTEWE